MKNEKQEIYNSALKYHTLGFVVFPVKVTSDAKKIPLIPAWQSLTLDSFNKHNWSNANAVGMLTGRSSDIFVLDLDIGSTLNGRSIPPTVCQKTGSGGKHYLFKYNKDYNMSNRVGIENKIDIRGDGGYIVIAPSWHPKGQYEWMVSIENDKPADAPEWLLTLIGNAKEYKKVDPKLAYGSPEGMRNQSAASVIGHILNNIHPNYWVDFGLGGLREWNKRNTPPLPDDELVKIFKSIAARQYAQRTK
jgi:hypothetical protein